MDSNSSSRSNNSKLVVCLETSPPLVLLLLRQLRLPAGCLEETIKPSQQVVFLVVIRLRLLQVDYLEASRLLQTLADSLGVHRTNPRAYLDKQLQLNLKPVVCFLVSALIIKLPLVTRYLADSLNSSSNSRGTACLEALSARIRQISSSSSLLLPYPTRLMETRCSAPLRDFHKALRWDPLLRHWALRKPRRLL